MRAPILKTAAALALLLALVVPPVTAQTTTDSRVATATDPTVASVQISQATFPGNQSLDSVVVARNDVFPDNLGGAGLTGSVRGVLLLTDGGPTAPLRAEVRTEISRVLRPQPGRTCAANDVTAQVFILGGTNAISQQAEQALRGDGWCVNRLAGNSRVETALAIANVIRTRSGLNEVLIARADNFADAATGGAYASRFDRPILVTNSDTLHPLVRADLFGRPAPFHDSIVMLGGTAALSQGVENDIRNQAANPSTGGSGANPTVVTRLSGPSRDSTAAAIGDRYEGQHISVIGGVAIVNGFTEDAWVYALTGGAVSWSTDLVVLYVDTNRIPDATCQFIARVRPFSITTFGPTNRVSDATATAARAIADGTASCNGTTPAPPPPSTPPPPPPPPPGTPPPPPPPPSGTVIFGPTRFTIPAGGIETQLIDLFHEETVQIDLIDDSGHDPVLDLLDPRANNIAHADSGGQGAGEQINQVMTESGAANLNNVGSYEIVMSESTGQTSDVILTVTLLPDLPIIDFTEDVTIDPGTCAAVTVQVPLTAGDIVTVEAIDRVQNGSDPFVDVIDPNGNSVAADDDSGFDLNSDVDFTATSTGAWRVVVQDLRCSGFPIWTVVTHFQ